VKPQHWAIWYQIKWRYKNYTSQKKDVKFGFDAIHNKLEKGKARLNRRDGFREYFFMSFLSLCGDVSILQVLKGKSLSQKLSTQGVLFGL